MDSNGDSTESIAKQFVKDHPLAAKTMDTNQNDLKISQNQKDSKRYLFEENIQILGVRFLKNERKGFEMEVQKAMNNLLHEAVMSSENPPESSPNDTNSSPTVSSTSLDLASIHFCIPTSLQDEVELSFDKKDETLLQNMLKLTKSNNEELFQDDDNSGSFDTFFKQINCQSIKVPVNQLFLYRGPLNSPIERCLSLTTTSSLNITPTSSDSTGSFIQRHQLCFVLYAESPAKVTEILDVFRRLHGINKNISLTVSKQNEFKVLINAEVEIQEEIYEGKWQTCPREKESFKLRTNLDKRICVSLYQDVTHYNYPIIKVERCFGMLLSPGRNINPSDMVAIGLNSMTTSTIIASLNQVQQWNIVGSWVPAELSFDYLNSETPRDTRVYFSVAVDLVIVNIEEPVRFVLEAKAKFVPPSNSMAVSATEKFWHNFTSKSAKQMQEQFNIIVRQKSSLHSISSSNEEAIYEVVSCLSSTQITQQKQRLSLQLNRNKIARTGSVSLQNTPSNPEAKTVETPSATDEPDEDDEPLQSGTGLVSKECSQSELQGWKDILEKWNLDLTVRPKQLSNLVRRGIPEALRPEVWQLLAGSHQEEEKLMQQYKNLVTKHSSFEAIIQRDIYRTFPAHERFRDCGSTGQESLFKICKAYSNFDVEIGYCQGLSFLVAALLLHMPEEQAFCVFVRIMYDYGLRTLYKGGLEELHCKFYQLERLLDEQLPELYSHFLDLNIETHMYASQWFLTLFTTKFPLNAVFLIIDFFLLDKMDTMLQIAVALLKMSKKNLLVLDFEGIMKYFRISLPKKYRTDESSRELIRTAIKINVKKAKKYKKEYQSWSEANKIRQNPLEHLENENKRLMSTTMRLEQENEDLATELLMTCNSKIKLRDDLDRSEDKAETLNSELLFTRNLLVEAEEEKRRLEEEVRNLKEMCRKEIEKAEDEIKNNRKIIVEYKQICKNYQNKFESEQQRSRNEINEICEKVKSCENCAKQIMEVINHQDGAGGCGSGENSIDSNNSFNNNADKNNGLILHKIDDLERELVKTKMALAESEDRNGQLVGKIHSTNSELNLLRAQADEAAKTSNTWLSKTLNTFRDVAKVKANNSITSGINATNSVEGGGGPIYEAVEDNQQSVRAPPPPPSAQQTKKTATRRNSSRDIYHE